MEKYVAIIFVIFCMICVASSERGIKDKTLHQHANPTNPQDLTIANPSITNSTKSSSLKDPKTPSIRFRYIPFRYPTRAAQNGNESVCLESSSEDFPKDVFSMEAKRNGAVVLHFILGIYCFTLLAVVCNDYFLPAVELICEKLNLSQDVAAATFMAIATSAPEFFVNIVGTFVTESDIGVGTIVGSSMFNTLGVAALGGMACKTHIQIEWWPITRDSIIYVCTIIMLVVMARDEQIQWYEAMILLIFYVVYFVIMWQNKRLYNAVMKFADLFRRKSIQFDNDVGSPEIMNSISSDIIKISSIIIVDIPLQELNKVSVHSKQEEQTPTPQEDVEEPFELWTCPSGSLLTKSWWIFSWPVRLLLVFTIPDCRRYPCMFPLTFIMCVVWIGTNSYLVSWMIAVIGATFRIPDFVMGVTFLAAGGCLPEAISIVIVAKKGQGGMGVSNSLGANTLDILLCLGLPWFVKTMVTWSSGGSSYIHMDSDSLFYTIIALILAVFVLYVTVALSGYKLSRKVGIVLMCMYVLFLAMAILLEMFMYYDGKLLPCKGD